MGVKGVKPKTIGGERGGEKGVQGSKKGVLVVVAFFHAQSGLPHPRTMRIPGHSRRE